MQAIAFKVLDVGKILEPGAFWFVCVLDDRLLDQQEALTLRSRVPLNKYLDDVILGSERQKIPALLAACCRRAKKRPNLPTSGY